MIEVEVSTMIGLVIALWLALGWLGYRAVRRWKGRQEAGHGQ